MRRRRKPRRQSTSLVPRMRPRARGEQDSLLPASDMDTVPVPSLDCTGDRPISERHCKSDGTLCEWLSDRECGRMDWVELCGLVDWAGPCCQVAAREYTSRP